MVHALTFSEWQATKFTTGDLADPGISGAAADPDADGCSNLLEYAFGRDPLAPDRGTPSIEQSSGGLTLTYPEAIAPTDLFYRLEESPDLTLWHWITPNDSTRQIAPVDDATRSVSIPLFNAQPSPKKWFARLRVALSSLGDTELLLAPTNLTAKLEIPFAITLGWNDNARIEDGFALERRVGPSGPWEEIGTTATDTNIFEDLAVIGSTEYSYRVCALQGEYASEFSNELILTTPLDTDGDGIPDDMEATYGIDPMLFSSGNNGVPDGWWIAYGMSPFSDPAADPDGDGRGNYQEFLDGTDPLTSDAAPNAGAEAPLTPSDLTLATMASGHNELAWTNNSTASGIIVERTEDGANWETVGLVAGTKTTFTDATAQLDIVYFYRLVAFN